MNINLSTLVLIVSLKKMRKLIANDMYGYSKYLGEKNLNKGIIIRTSTIGHELKNQYGLLEWFLNNKISY